MGKIEGLMVRTAALASGLLAALLFSATSVQAQSTAVTQAAPQSSTVTDPTSAQIDSWIAGNHGEVDSADAQVDGRPLRDGHIHGEVGASIGSGGYRSAYGIATAPLGANSEVTVGLANEHLGDGNRSYRGQGYGGGYGGDRRSLFIGLNLNGANEPSGCDPLQPRPWAGAREPLTAAPAACPPVAPSPSIAPR